eukprot:gene1792-3480_t
MQYQVLYGTETGTAEEVAFKIFKTLKKSNANVKVESMDEYDIRCLPSERVVIFVVSTTGDGTAPTNMQSFWKFLLRKSLGMDSLSAMKFVVFGLGDSSYEKFNATARRLTTRLKQLGAQELIPVGLGDDQARYGYFTALDDWLNKLWACFNDQFKLEVKTNERNDELDEPIYDIEITPGHELPVTHQQTIYHDPPSSCRHPESVAALTGQVLENTRLTVDSWEQNVRHIRISLLPTTTTPIQSAASYNSGDIAVIHPSNDPLIVTRLINLYKDVLSPHSWLEITPRNRSTSTTSTSTSTTTTSNKPSKRRLGTVSWSVHTLFSRYLNIAGIPNRSFFEGLALFTPASRTEEREKLLEIASSGGIDLYYDYCVRERRTFVDVLEDFKASRPWLLARLLELIPIHICVAVVERKTPLGKKRIGICSGYLNSLSTGDTIHFWIKEGLFKLPPVNVPLIMVGPGTGVAPMRAMLQDRILDMNEIDMMIMKEKTKKDGDGDGDGQNEVINETMDCIHMDNNSKNHIFNEVNDQKDQLLNVEIPETILFFGCRKQHRDFLYNEEFRPLLLPSTTSTERSIITTSTRNIYVIPSFSQDQLQKHYVTHEIRRNAHRVWSLLSQGAYVYIAGAAKRMPADVRKALYDVITDESGLSKTDVEAFMNLIDKDKRYIVEAWS